MPTLRWIARLAAMVLAVALGFVLSGLMAIYLVMLISGVR